MANPEITSSPTGRYVAVHRLVGATVFNTALEPLGTLTDVIIDTESARIGYAVLTIGGFLGFGDRAYPLPWVKLKFNTELEGYVVDIDRDVLEHVPSLNEARPAYIDDAGWAQQIDNYYRVSA